MYENVFLGMMMGLLIGPVAAVALMWVLYAIAKMGGGNWPDTRG